jgi:hypothetical protein
MKDSKKFNDILDRCVDRVLKGETIERCLADNPDYAAELRPLLEVAVMARQTAGIAPRPEFKEEARRRLLAAMAADPVRVRKESRRMVFHPRWVVAFGVIGALLLSTGGTALASTNALPGDALYSVKIATENVRLAVTSDENKAEVYAVLANRRVEEIVQLTAKDEPALIDYATGRLTAALDNIVSVAEDRDESPSLFNLGFGATSSADESPKETIAATTTAVPTTTAPQTTKPGLSVTTTTAAANGTSVKPPPAVAGNITAESSDNSALTSKTNGTTANRSQVLVPGTTSPSQLTSLSNTSTSNKRVDLKSKVQNDAQWNSDLLKKSLDNAPESAKSALKKAIDVSESGYQKAIDSIK